jgi:hypothetical protein
MHWSCDGSPWSQYVRMSLIRRAVWRLDKNRFSRTTTRTFPLIQSHLRGSVFSVPRCIHLVSPASRSRFPLSGAPHIDAHRHRSTRPQRCIDTTSRPAPTNIARTCLRAIANAGVAWCASDVNLKLETLSQRCKRIHRDRTVRSLTYSCLRTLIAHPHV